MFKRIKRWLAERKLSERDRQWKAFFQGEWWEKGA
jgi:hypothetical protein